MGDVGFYTPEGRSMRKAFLRMPVELARISSKFNPRRLHPISKTVRPHRGVDYAAKSGTPIMASGNGKIVHLGRKGNYGKTIVIQHGTSINTLYAHMSGYYKDLKVGSRVTQGQVIGYIGATGAVTGPHLHYEFRVDGVHKNPLTVKLPKAISLDPTEKKAFSIVAQAALKQLNFAPSDPSIPEKLAINGINTAHEKP
jgi:murein DD-endopeptidase MepM/ murein hydrolase activator NlpD